METVIVNLTAKARDATLHGRRYKVAPATMIVPGVLPGSQGPLLYTPEETGRNPSGWDGVPLLLGHPVENGVHVSGRHPAVWEKQLLGHVFGANADEAGRLKGEAWFDVEATRRIAPTVLAALETGTPIELSTGLYLDSEAAPAGATHNGTAYSHVARNFRPDHLAVLVGEKGACSLEHGCGILANAEDKGLFRRLMDWLKGGGQVPTENAWSEAAREAAAEARRANHPAVAEAAREAVGRAKAAKIATEKMPPPLRKESEEALKVSQEAEKAGTKDAHEKAGLHHRDLAEKHRELGNPTAEKYHREAAGAHYRASGELSAIPGTRNAHNTTQNRGETTVDKKALVSWLTANCDCWKGSEPVLNGMSEEALKKLHADAKRLHTVNVLIANAKGKRPRVVVNADGEGEVAGVSIADLADLFQITTDPKTDPVGFTKELKTALEGALAKLSMDGDAEDAMDGGADEAVENPDGTPVAMSAHTPTGNRRKKAPTVNEWLAGAPREVQSAVRAAMEIERGERTRLARQLVANVDDEARKKKLWAKFMAQPIDELRDLVSLLPGEERPEEPVANYFGAAGGPADGAWADDSQNLLPVFNVDRAEMAAEGLRRKQA